MKSTIKYRICDDRDHSAMAEFLYSLGNELLIDKHEVASEIVALLADRGDAVAGFLNGRMVALVGYLRGDPANDYANKHICFIYVLGIAEQYRCSRVFLDGYRAMMKELEGHDFAVVRCQADRNNQYTNRIYDRLFRPDGQATNRRGLPVNQYSLPFEEAAQRLAA